MLKNISTELEQFNDVQSNTTKITRMIALIKELQKERGLVSGFLGSNTKNFQEELLLQRALTEKKLELFENCCAEENALYISLDLTTLRGKIDALRISPRKAFDEYTHMIEKIISAYLMMTQKITHTEIENKFYLNANLMRMYESLGKIRGSFNAVFSSKKLGNQSVYYIVHAKGEYDDAYRTFISIAPKHYVASMHKIIMLQEYSMIENTIKKYGMYKDKYINKNPKEWFAQSSVVIDEMYKLQADLLNEVELYMYSHAQQLKIKFAIGLFVMLLVGFLIFYLGHRIKNDILKSVKLLNEYKNAVDRSSIVSKTDTKGRIIYANDKFCEISGYTQEELIGKPHNIVRDPKISSTMFEQMWRDILQGKSWTGRMRNKKKTEGFYTVEVTINPIVNHKGEIEEFIAIRNDVTELIELQQEIQNTQRDLVYKLGEIGETRSKETGFHVKRVAKYSEILAFHYGLSEEEITNLTNASPMHDIGKIAIPDHILNKAGKLTESEWEIMQTHAEIGYSLFKDSNKALLQTAAIISYEHHEKYDGSGYPRRLKGEAIDIKARITALADVFDALGSQRCYKKAWEDEKTFAYIKEESGKHFDPKLVSIFFEHLEEFLEIRERYSDKSSFMKES